MSQPSISTEPVATTVVTKDDAESSSVMVYILIAVISIILILIFWYAYNKFADQCDSSDRKNSDDGEQEKDEAIADYDLDEAIGELNKIQNNILKTLSNDVGI